MMKSIAEIYQELRQEYRETMGGEFWFNQALCDALLLAIDSLGNPGDQTDLVNTYAQLEQQENCTEKDVTEVMKMIVENKFGQVDLAEIIEFIRNFLQINHQQPVESNLPLNA